MSEQVLNGAEDQAPSINDFQVTVNGEAFTLGQLASSATAAQLLYIAFQQQADAAEADKRTALQALQNEVDGRKAENSELQSHYDELRRDADALRANVSQLYIQVDDLKRENADIESKRNAAAEALKEAKAELEQVKSHRDDLQAQLAVGVRGAIKVDAAAALEAYKKEEAEKLAAKPAIYDVHALDQRKSKYGASLLNGDYIEIPHLELGKYRELKPEEVEAEVARFRAEQASQTAETADNVGTADDHADSALVTPPPLDGEAFQGETEVPNMDPTTGLADAKSDVESDGETFEEEVKRRLHELEITVFGAGWANK